MKKIFYALSILFNLNMLNAQQNLIISKLDPLKSNGYLKWDDFDNLGYRVRIFEKQNNGNINEIEVIETQKKYLKLSSENLNKKNRFYRIEGKSSQALSVINDIDIKPIRNYEPGDKFNFISCTKTCNGREYAYRLVSYGVGIVKDQNGDGEADIDANGNYILDDSGRRFLRLEGSGFDYFDLNGNIAPYYIAMTELDLNQYRNLYNMIYSPYQLTQNQDYFYYPNYISADDGFTRRDGYKYTGNGAYLVEKSLFQFNWMASNRTPDLLYTDNLCSQPFTGSNNVGWLGTWNSNMEYYGSEEDDYFGNFYNSNPNPLIYKNQLECLSNASTNGGGVNQSDWAADIYESWFACIDDWVNNGYPEDLIDCGPALPGSGSTVPGNPVPHWNQYIKKMFFYRIDNNSDSVSTPIEYQFENMNEFYNPNNLILEAGLYKMYAIFSSGKIIPLIFEHKPENTVIRKVADFVELNIAPNPIENNQLKVEIKSLKKIRYKLQVHNLDGLILHSEESNIDLGATKNVSINVNKNEYQFNQVRVHIIFEDGSEIQKIAFRPN